MADENDSNVQSLTDHLAELRDRVIMSIYGLVLAGILCFWKSDLIFDFIREPIEPFLPQKGLIFTGVTEKFMAHLKMSIISGIIVSCPWWLYQVWCFVAPGLYRKEKRYAVAFLTFGTGLFLSGTAFAYYVVFPAAFKYLLAFGGTTDVPLISLGEYISFFMSMVTMFGAAFELPLVIVLLSMLGIVDATFLRAGRRYAVVMLAFVSAVITPPDLLSMVLMLAPMLLLYEISILVVSSIAKRQAASHESKA